MTIGEGGGGGKGDLFTARYFLFTHTHTHIHTGKKYKSGCVLVCVSVRLYVFFLSVYPCMCVFVSLCGVCVRVCLSVYRLRTHKYLHICR